MNKTSKEISQQELTAKTLRRIYNRGKRKGYVSPEYIEKTVKNKNIPSDKLEEVLDIFKEEGIKLMDEAQAALEPVVKKKRGRKKGSTNKKTNKNIDGESDDLAEGDDILGKTDDPVRMYLREMGGVELLSREGEIAIAKRIEPGKEVMLNALTQSPLVAKKIFEWKEEIENQKILVRDIIDIDSTYEDFEESDEDDEENISKSNNKQKAEKKDTQEKTDDN